MSVVVTIDDVRAAALRIAPHVHRTPVLTCRSLDEHAGVHLHLKAENLQKGGAFKARGALNTVLQLSPAERARGIITHSSGNHAQGVAIAARAAGAHAVVVMPAWANPLKRAATLGYGAEVVQEGVTGDNRDDVTARLQAERGLVLVHPYDDERVIAGQGTVGLELAEQVADLEAVYVPVGGGGLIAGVATALKALRPSIRVVGVETEGADDCARSLATGVRQHLDATPSTIADGIRTLSVGERNWDVIRRLVDEMVVVSDAEVMTALRLLLTRAKTVVEPTGAVAATAVLVRRHPRPGARVAAILSGGNLDLELFRREFPASPPV